MTFEEEFPSFEIYSKTELKNDDFSIDINASQLQKYCLDKQRVSELYIEKALVNKAIDKIVLEYQEAHKSIHKITKFTPMHLAIRLKTEVGL